MRSLILILLLTGCAHKDCCYGIPIPDGKWCGPDVKAECMDGKCARFKCSERELVDI